MQLRGGGVLLISIAAAGTVVISSALQQGLQQIRPELDRHSSPTLLRRTARFDPDPSRRRLARLILANQGDVSAARQQWLLHAQGWGDNPLSPVVLKQQALAARALGQQERSDRRWTELLQRFPAAAPSADALYYLGQPGDEQHQELLQRFAAHPAALAAAVDWDRQTQDPRAGLHLAAWGARWPGADAALQRACLRDLGDQQREQVATALAQQGDLDAALNCLGDLRPTAPKTLQWLGLAAEAPLSPEQQAWEQSRSLLLERDWNGAQEALQQQLEQPLTPPLLARVRFWLGLSAWELGDAEQARQIWQQLLREHPFGYYGWRASERLQQAPDALPLESPPAEGLLPKDLDQLLALEIPVEAWEQWRMQRGGRPAESPRELWQEGVLRLGVGDRWIALEQLDRAQRLGAAEGLSQQVLLEQHRHPRNFEQLLDEAAGNEQLDPDLLLGLARQESRLTPTVRSSAGAIGLLQLLPSTAAELDDPAPSEDDLLQPERNAPLGARYLKEMLNAADGNPFLATASYNAGPGAAGSWRNDDLDAIPELWVEAIPYPETRIYVKKVLGNRWTYALLGDRLTNH